MKKIIILGVLVMYTQALTAGKSNKSELQPYLIVGVVVDQMRYDYLYRFYDQYSENGFKRLMREGMNFTYAQYNYIPTYTGPGHASIYTGSVPYYHGIISNDWYDKARKKTTYCVKDPDVKTVGAENNSGLMSPKNLLSTTISDQLRMSDNGNSKVFSISIKDRASILPGGKMANAAYWYDGKSGYFVTSTWYMKELPAWVTRFNALNLPSTLMKSGWQLENDKNYKVSLPDDGPGEVDVFREGKTVFPHQFNNLNDSARRELVKTTPFGNELLVDFFNSLIENEKPGQGDFCDFVAISFSSTDYVGHAYGPNSVEIMDTYLKLDKQIGSMLDTLDKYIGKGNYLLFLTADHGVKPNSAYLEANRIPSGQLMPKTIKGQMEDYCKSRFGTNRIIETVQDNQIYLNHNLIDSLNLNIKDISNQLVSFMEVNFPFIRVMLPKEALLSQTPSRSMNSCIINGYNIIRSGDISFELIQNYITSDTREGGTTHESSYHYDTHVPLIFFGWHIKPGESSEEVFIEDIAPTISNLIHIQEPDAALGIPLIK